MDSSEDLDNDPYKNDCSEISNMNAPHAYSEFSIQNGQMKSFVCIEKPPGNFLIRFITFLNCLVYSNWSEYSSCSTTCGSGQKTRHRQCIGGICSRATDADLSETDSCYNQDCKYWRLHWKAVDYTLVYFNPYFRFHIMEPILKLQWNVWKRNKNQNTAMYRWFLFSRNSKWSHWYSIMLRPRL